MSHVAVARLAYAHPGGELLFSEVSFRVSPGQHVGLVGSNGVGKSTLFKVLTGGRRPDDGDVSVGGIVGYMAQDVGSAPESFEGTVVAVSHDRAFLRTMDRFLMVLHDGLVLALPSYDSALEALLDPVRAGDVRLAKVL